MIECLTGNTNIFLVSILSRVLVVTRTGTGTGNLHKKAGNVSGLKSARCFCRLSGMYIERKRWVLVRFCFLFICIIAFEYQIQFYPSFPQLAVPSGSSENDNVFLRGINRMIARCNIVLYTTVPVHNRWAHISPWPSTDLVIRNVIHTPVSHDRQIHV